MIRSFLTNLCGWLRLYYADSEFVRAELAYLQRSAGLSRYHVFVLGLAGINVLVAPIPILATGRYADIPFHAAIGATLLLFCFVYDIYIIALAVNSIDRERQSQTWDSLRLTGVDANRIVAAKWQAVMRYLLGINFLLAMSRFAIAYSAMQILNIYPKWIDLSIYDWNRAFVYFSYGQATSSVPVAYYPQWWQYVAAAVTLTLVSLASTSFLVSLGVRISLIKPNSPFLKVSLVLFGRACLTVIGVAILIAFGQWETYAHRHHWVLPYGNLPVRYIGCDYPALRQNTTYTEWCFVERDRRRVFESMQVAGVAIADNGIFLAANILRPIASWQFVLRNVAATWVVSFVMASAAALNLWIAAKLVYQQLVQVDARFSRRRVFDLPTNK